MPPKRPTPANSKLPAAEDVKQESALGEQAQGGAPNDAPIPSAASSPGVSPPKRPSSVTRLSSSASTRGGKPVIAPKPKFTGRRSQAARQEAEQAAAKKKSEEAAAAVAEAREKAQEARRYGYNTRGDRGGRGSSRGSRGRGGHMGDSFRQREEPVASGPFSAGKTYSEATSRRSGWGSGGGSGALGSGGGPGLGASKAGGPSGSIGAGSGTSWSRNVDSDVKMEYGMDTGHASMKVEDGGYVSSEDEDVDSRGPKQNIDHLQVVDLTGEEDEQVLAPVRLMRVPHKDRAVAVNLDRSDDSNDEQSELPTEKRKGKQRAKDVEFTGATERQMRPAAYSSSDTEAEPVIKEEPRDQDEDAEMTTAPPATAVENGIITEQQQDPSSSPESKRKAKARIKATVSGSTAGDDFPIPPKPKFETDADEIEWNRKYLDLRMLRDELGPLIPRVSTQSRPGRDAQGDTDMADATAAPDHVKAQQMRRDQNAYLFQFPPVLPGLTPVIVKRDPEGVDYAAGNSDAMHTMNDKENSKNAAADESAAKDKSKMESEQQTSEQPALPSGAVGKLRIHRSGKATLDWGGTSLSLATGTDATFLQNIMITKMPDKKPDDEKAAANADQEPAYAMGMGLIRGKFVVTPNWDDILK